MVLKLIMIIFDDSFSSLINDYQLFKYQPD